MSSRIPMTTETKRVLGDLIRDEKADWGLTANEIMNHLARGGLHRMHSSAVNNWMTGATPPRTDFLGGLVQLFGVRFQAQVDRLGLPYEFPNPGVRALVPDKEPSNEIPADAPLPPEVMAAAVRSGMTLTSNTPQTPQGPSLSDEAGVGYNPLARLMSQATVAIAETYVQHWVTDPKYLTGQVPSGEMVTGLIDALRDVQSVLKNVDPSKPKEDTADA